MPYTSTNPASPTPPPPKTPTIERWSSPGTWPGGKIPASGDTVVIPSGRSVLLDADISVVLLDIEGTLTVADQPGGIKIDARYVVVRSGGSMIANINTNSLIITLSGGPELPVFGQKVLAVSDGTLLLTGRPVGPSWVQLTRDAPAEASTLYVSGDTSLWPIGGEVAIAPTTIGSGGTEVFTIVAVSGTTITLNGTLRTPRSGTIDARGVDRRAEVALLTRSIVIRGDGSDDRIGAHVMLSSMSAAPITAHLSNILLTNVGQGGQLGRCDNYIHRSLRCIDEYEFAIVVIPTAGILSTLICWGMSRASSASKTAWFGGASTGRTPYTASAD